MIYIGETFCLIIQDTITFRDTTIADRHIPYIRPTFWYTVYSIEGI